MNIGKSTEQTQTLTLKDTFLLMHEDDLYTFVQGYASPN